MSRYNTQPEGNPSHGYLLNFSPADSAVQHEFCGAHQIPGAACPNCHKPLLRILSLNAKDMLLNFDPAKTPLVHLLYCWTCSIPYGEFSYEIEPDGGIRIVRVPERKPESEFGPGGPYDRYTGIYPLQMVALKPLNDADDAKLAKARKEKEEGDFDPSGDLFEPRHQIGGSPFIYNPETLTCPGCSRDMPVLAAICDDAIGNNPWGNEEAKTFTANGGVQMIFQFCRDCAIVSAYHSCD